MQLAVDSSDKNGFGMVEMSRKTEKGREGGNKSLHVMTANLHVHFGSSAEDVPKLWNREENFQGSNGGPKMVDPQKVDPTDMVERGASEWIGFYEFLSGASKMAHKCSIQCSS